MGLKTKNKLTNMRKIEIEGEVYRLPNELKECYAAQKIV